MDQPTLHNTNAAEALARQNPISENQDGRSLVRGDFDHLIHPIVRRSGVPIYAAMSNKTNAVIKLDYATHHKGNLPNAESH